MFSIDGGSTAKVRPVLRATLAFQMVSTKVRNFLRSTGFMYARSRLRYRITSGKKGEIRPR